MDNYQHEIDLKALKQAYQELEWKQNEVNRLERAVQFGRCIKCDEPLMNDEKIICTDCKKRI